MDKLLLTEWKLRALEGNVSRQFYCERGVVWITAGPRDITLRAGESWTQPVTAAGCKVLVQSMVAESVCWVWGEVAPARFYGLQRWLAALPGSAG